MSKKLHYNVVHKMYSKTDFNDDCPNSDFVPTVLPPVKRIISIGDIHGDYELAVKSFKLANLIDDNMNWIAIPKNTVVVQVGDQIDSCRPINGQFCKDTVTANDSADDVKILQFFDLMHSKAKIHGGAVYSLLGNHELMNAVGDFRYVSLQNYKNFSYDTENGRYTGPDGRKQAFQPGGIVAKKMACNRLSVLIIGSNMFVHAGVLPGLVNRLEHLSLDSHSKLEYLNAIVRKWLLGKISLNSSSELNSILNDHTDSPFWARVFGAIPENTPLTSERCSNTVKKTLQVFKIGKIVVGHTPQKFTSKNGINGTCYSKNMSDNSLYRIDGGFSKAFDSFGVQGKIQVLEIIDDNIFNIITSED